jgi:hypothetical protein
MQISFLKAATSAAAICFCTVAFAQQQYSVSGTIKDKKNGELLIGVTVKVAENPGISVVANEYGFYSLSLPKGTYHLLISNPGFKDFQQSISVEENIKQDIELVSGEEERVKY